MKAITALKSRLSQNNTLYIQNEGGHLSEAGFEWNEPATIEEIYEFEGQNQILLPETYKEFLRISNGALIFKDIQYGQWGCKVLGLNDILKVTSKKIKVGCQLKKYWTVFATWLGDGDMLVFDLNKYKAGEKNYIIDADQGYQTNKWVYIQGDFSKWIDRLIVAQGAKYWRWY
ncbi:MAG: SMI1/KNR4 family protein [Firmicutes bacterium]|nr:SMI1/KNR4 family protein [Bacillota bacterium]